MVILKAGNKLIRYDTEKYIGKGSKGTVFYGIHHGEGGKAVAVKRIERVPSHADESAIQLERQLMDAAINHTNILRHICTEKDDTFWYIVTELCAGTLEDYFNGNYQGPRSLNEWEIVHQVTAGLTHLHSLGIVHRDIKPKNILIFVPPKTSSSFAARPQVKLADFGISKILKDGKNDFTNTNVTDPSGTRGWISPEQYDSTRFGFKVDIFSLGCILGYTLSGGMKHPFGDDDDINQHMKRANRIVQREPILMVQEDLKKAYSRADVAFELMQSMLNTDPIKRCISNRCVFNLDRTQQLLNLCTSFSDDTDGDDEMFIVFKFKQLVNDPTVDIHAVTPNGQTLLHLLCKSQKINKECIEIARLLVEKGADVNVTDGGGSTPLHILCISSINRNNYSVPMDMLQFLVEKGADVNAKDRNGNTPLLLLCCIPENDNLIDVARFLIENGADVNVKESNNGWSPLHFLSLDYKKDNMVEIVQLLIENGADVNAEDVNGKRPIHFLCKYYQKDDLIELLGLLMKHGADVNVKDKCDGNTPLHCLCDNYSRKDKLMGVVQLLVMKGADVKIERKTDGLTPDDILQ